MAIHFKKPLCTFIHIPKTAGSSFEQWCYDNIDYDRQQKHCTLLDAKNIWPDLGTTFTFVRNPFDRILSSYLNWTINHTPDFDKYIDMVKMVVENKLYLYKGAFNKNDISHYIPMTTMIGNHKLDFIGKFENYENDIKKLSEISDMTNLNEIIIKKRNIDYRTFYNERNKKIISELYKDDLKEFNYTF